MKNSIFKNFRANFVALFKNRALIHVFLFLFVFCSLTFFASINYFPTKTIAEGEVSPMDIRVPATKKIIDEIATKRAKDEAAKKAEIVYKQDPIIIYNQEIKIETLFEIIEEIQELKKTNEFEKITALKKDIPLKIPTETLQILLEFNPGTLSEIKSLSKDILAKTMQESIKPEDIANAKNKSKILSNNLPVTETIKYLIQDIVENAMAPNIVLDWEATMKSREEKMAQVEPVKINIKRGQIIVRQGDIVTAKQKEILKALGLHQQSFNLKAILGISIFTLILIILIIISLAQQQPKIFFNDKNLLLLSLIIVATSGFSKISTSFFSGYLTTTAIASILITVLLDWRLALLVTSLLSLQIGIFTGEFYPLIVAMIGGVMGIFSSTKINQRWDLVLAGIIISLINIFLIASFGLIEGKGLSIIATNLMWGGIGGIGSGVLALGFLPLFEHLFATTTHIKLLELSNPNDPLLQKLLMEAPGTYQHSITVATLAQNAARIMGADPLLARIGAYYHDIGKIRRPYFFVENQISCENPHDKISPTLSTLIITSHVKDGLDLATTHHLPAIIINFIKEHHGTSLVSYFYHQAQARGETDKENFRYPGPKPQGKETAIVMLADAVEAASRTLTNPTPQKIENMVKQIIKDILNDEQLDESELSLKDINDISTTFIHDLTGMYHRRIEYPEKIEESKQKKEKHDKNNKSNSKI